ncbi:hypothetical protein V5799_021231 [Amblyomma americanum]|uniref:Peptide-N(4)-(N-acetyl-beta-glucosaminyl)asparagine amidase n=1 Tax=Amblyomma americanum TaxID=6943 RepID=A0AAQ4FQM1_AMBAM
MEALVMNVDENLYTKIKTNLSRVQVYERRDLQEKALACIPVSELTRKAQLTMIDHASRNTPDKDKRDPGFRDFLLMELLHWFKESFFTWVDTLKCSRCGGATTNVGAGEPTAEEIAGGASRVELHGCPKCQTLARFPRFNYPPKLLETRRGRCGEWANCFTFFARSLSFDARYVLDWTDHVWTEVYSDSQQRWLHCDPCEALCDAPLVYEAGWGKKLSYIFAFSKDEVQDVTWRYTSNFEAVQARRVAYSEAELIQLMLALTRQCQESYTQKRREELLLRRVLELAEFLAPKKVTESELQGRLSGALAWRQQRGELGSWVPFTYKPANCRCKNIIFKYSSAMDKYSIWEDGVEANQVLGWAKGAFSIEKMFRKVEQDWKMSYLARQEDSAEGSLSWRLELSPGRTIERLDLTCAGTTYENGCVRWSVSTDEESIPIEGSNGVHSITSLKKANFVCLKAVVTGGRGTSAWQHAQLCREPLDSQHYSLEIAVTLSE